MNVIRNIFARLYAGIFLPAIQGVFFEDRDDAGSYGGILNGYSQTVVIHKQPFTNNRRKKTRACGFLSSLQLSLKQRESKIR